MIAAQGRLAKGFLCFTTHRVFDEELNTPWREAGKRLFALLQEQGAKAPTIALAGQVHGTSVEVIRSAGGALQHSPRCDGLVTAERGVFLVIRTADCLPIVLADPEAGVCGALHAGWRGCFANILEEGIAQMRKLGAESHRLRGWIGPAISRANYEVSEELARQFREQHGGRGDFLEGRHLDLPRLAKLQARDAGMEESALRNNALCTFERSDLFHSHRRQGRVRGHLFTVSGFLP